MFFCVCSSLLDTHSVTSADVSLVLFAMVVTSLLVPQTDEVSASAIRVRVDDGADDDGAEGKHNDDAASTGSGGSQGDGNVLVNSRAGDRPMEASDTALRYRASLLDDKKMALQVRGCVPWRCSWFSSFDVDVDVDVDVDADVDAGAVIACRW